MHAYLWGRTVLTILVPKTQPSVVAPFVTLVKDSVSGERERRTRHACMHFSPFLTTDVVSLATSSSHPDFPTAMDYNLEFRVKTNPFSPRFLWLDNVMCFVTLETLRGPVPSSVA